MELSRETKKERNATRHRVRSRRVDSRWHANRFTTKAKGIVAGQPKRAERKVWKGEQLCRGRGEVVKNRARGGEKVGSTRLRRTGWILSLVVILEAVSASPSLLSLFSFFLSSQTFHRSVLTILEFPGEFYRARDPNRGFQLPVSRFDFAWPVIRTTGWFWRWFKESLAANRER